MKKSFLTSLCIVLICFFCCPNFIYNTSAAVSEPNKTDVSASVEKSVVPDINEIGKEKQASKTETTVVQNKASDYNLGLLRHSFELGPEYYNFTYTEPSGHTIKDTGDFFGGVLNYTYRGWVPASPNEPFGDSRGVFRAEFRFANGNADYDGYLVTTTPGGNIYDPYEIHDITFYAYETRLLFGIDALDKNWLASLSTGVGYRYSTDDTSFDPYGYKRESNYIYIPIAYQLDGKFENNWAWGFKLEADILAWGQQESYLSHIGDPDITNRQKQGYGLRGAVNFQNKTKLGIFIIEPFIRFWDISQSESKYYAPYEYNEPKNNTIEFGIHILWRV